MKFKGRMELERWPKHIDIIPVINIMFILLLFLIFAPTMVAQPGIKVNLPKLLTSQAVQKGIVEIIISSDNSLYLNSKLISKDELSLFFEESAKRGQSVLIRADKNASLGNLAGICDLARNSGINQINIATNQ